MRSKEQTTNSLNKCEILTVLLPVHNRGMLTANFVRHISEMLPEGMNLRVVIFDDGCTDDTVANIRNVWPSIDVVSLDGSAFWGGAINAISGYIKSRTLSEDSIYLLANDDIKFPSKSAFLAGLRMVDRGALVCAKGCLVKSLNANNLGNIHHPTTHDMHYNSKTGNFEKATLSKPVNVSSTYAMFTTKDAWLSAPSVPLTIPHYLSDYWLTYKLVLQGYKIVHPDNFICLVSLLTTYSRPACEKKNWLRIKVNYLQSSLNKSSPSYFPAWIEYLSQKPIHPSVRIKILKLKLYKFAGSLLYSRNSGVDFVALH